ncbi:MAG: K(+)-transporting ATPase subunit F [Coleofasciculaceae cyanobacterium SM2_1_6]|nr:K(+)-transporting ATPase subunit F [Coleofasciculaceae cyanobacterium SM2_1_6]
MKIRQVLADTLGFDLLAGKAEIKDFSRQNSKSIAIFLLLCLNLPIAQVVYAQASAEITPKTAWSIALLGLVILALCVYLFAVILQPEKF